MRSVEACRGRVVAIRASYSRSFSSTVLATILAISAVMLSETAATSLEGLRMFYSADRRLRVIGPCPLVAVDDRISASPGFFPLPLLVITDHHRNIRPLASPVLGYPVVSFGR